MHVEVEPGHVPELRDDRGLPALRVAEEELHEVRAARPALAERVDLVDVGTDPQHLQTVRRGGCEPAGVAHLGRRLGQGLFPLGLLVLLLVLVQPTSGVGAASTAIGTSAASGQQTPPPGRLPEPASNRAYGLPVVLAIVAAGGVLSLLVRVLLAEGSRNQQTNCRPDRSTD